MDIDAILREMTLEEKAGLCSGADMWSLKGVPRLGVPSVSVSDGPYGLRKQTGGKDNLGLFESLPTICFPAACGAAASFDRGLIREMGAALGEIFTANDVSVILGPAMNIKRSPLCGRNFEYFSEDPFLTGELATEYTIGAQEKGAGVSAKHFALNNQEKRRFSTSANVDERTMREIYLAAFETLVKRAQPQTIMSSYNAVNGVTLSENKYLLTDILREEWGFEGYVMSDWGAALLSDRVKTLSAGLDLEMPGGNVSAEHDAQIVSAVRTGELSEEVLDTAVRRILGIIRKAAEYTETHGKTEKSLDEYHRQAALAARETAVLLKNRGVLPLKPGKKTAFIGEFAKTPRCIGGGSSHVHPYRLVSAWDAAKGENVTFAQGFSLSDPSEDGQLLREAVEAAKAADVAVLFLGLPDREESEGFDRRHLRLSDAQNRLAFEIAKVQPNVAVVLHNGAPVEMPWIDEVNAVLEVYLGGEGVGEATADLLFGRANPCGKLPETFPVRLEDNPSFLNFPGDGDRCVYGEGIYVGYRYYDKKKIAPLFPFGHGLSYTQFAYSDLSVSRTQITRDEGLTVSVKIQNVGQAAGKEIVQLYVSDRTGAVARPEKELKGFEKVALAAGEAKTVTFSLCPRSFAYYDVAEKDWAVPAGEFEILIGKSSREIELSAKITVRGTARRFTVTRDTAFGKVWENPVTQAALAKLIGFQPGAGLFGMSEEIMLLLADTPLASLKMFTPVTDSQLTELIAALNTALES
ncbi:MAG: glycoside hydrolase family 3 C-terminal domain-containing protein [Clostridium sp.]|jgi:beta-glucosidase|nr:glycoside hydrolase family 3 C-terminal domain-containing protein [Clostridium sp.]